MRRVYPMQRPRAPQGVPEAYGGSWLLEDFIASISGHKDMREIRIYVEAANKARQANRRHGADARALP